MLLSEFLLSAYRNQPFVTVLGHPVSHSRSPGVHNAALAYHKIEVRYHAVDCPSEQTELLPELFSLNCFRGANITIPLKQKILHYMDDLDESAREIGAVNTVVPEKKSNRLTGYNTDAYGFIKPLTEINDIRTATILGTGGASRAASFALLKYGVEKLYLASRSAGKQAYPQKNPSIVHLIPYDNLETAIRRSQLIVNTTPVGMYPDIEKTPVPSVFLPLLEGKFCYDIIYNPVKTRFLQEAEEYGAQIIGGLDMFIHQAALSFELWFGREMPVHMVRNVLLNLLTKP